ncbi:MAG: response regulator [Candidatus Devosia phytovorans]|uniref:Response regulator n=1 Tax=Candidatus Devosia phytovorans TaxID=3121372 RepID=A0AAJ5VUU4_9HYPH|nr:response regulator [Devosia sp.]WEK05219.1 MAG: response regulator [Devosia sp.]
MDQIRRVMVVEDEVMLLLDLMDNLADHGIDSLPLGMADGAARTLCKSDVDALITDIDLPGQNSGLDLAWRCAQLKPNLPIVVVSGGVRPTQAQLPPNAVFVPKPYGINQILSALDRRVRRAA